METLDKFKKQLESMIPIFEETAIKCVKILFQKEASSTQPWKVVDHLSVEFTNLVTMGSANESFKSLILAGVPDHSIAYLLDDTDFEMEYLADLLGEFVNSYCALLDDNEEYSKIFGKQIQAVPMLYIGGAPFVSFLWGIQGMLTIGKGELYMGYVIQHSHSDSEMEESHG